jgi:hypothetical protein
MPLLPLETHQKIRRREQEHGGPDRMGEEGILHIVTSGDERYFAKQWYTVSEKRMTSEPETEVSPASPYWHKVKFYEGQLIHAAFPDISVQMAAAYDPRIQKNADGVYEFTHTAGRPVTLTKEVAADPALQGERDAITDPLYNHMLGYHRDTYHGWYASPEERREFYRLIAESDKKIETLFGSEGFILDLTLYGPPLDGGITMHNAKEIADRSKVNNRSNSPLARFWRYGVLAIHPHINFIPEGKDPNTQTIRGKYIEFGIFDLQRFVHAWQADHGSDQLREVIPKLRRYELARALDDLFDRITNREYANGQWSCHQPAVKAALFKVTEAIRHKCEDYSPVLLQQLYSPTINEVERIVNRNPEQPMIIAKLTELAERIFALPVDTR